MTTALEFRYPNTPCTSNSVWVDCYDSCAETLGRFVSAPRRTRWKAFCPAFSFGQYPFPGCTTHKQRTSSWGRMRRPLLHCCLFVPAWNWSLLIALTRRRKRRSWPWSSYRKSSGEGQSKTWWGRPPAYWGAYHSGSPDFQVHTPLSFFVRRNFLVRPLLQGPSRSGKQNAEFDFETLLVLFGSECLIIASVLNVSPGWLWCCRCLKAKRSGWSWSRSCVARTPCRRRASWRSAPTSRLCWPYRGSAGSTPTRYSTHPHPYLRLYIQYLQPTEIIPRTAYNSDRGRAHHRVNDEDFLAWEFVNSLEHQR